LRQQVGGAAERSRPSAMFCVEVPVNQYLEQLPAPDNTPPTKAH